MNKLTLTQQQVNDLGTVFFATLQSVLGLIPRGELLDADKVSDLCAEMTPIFLGLVASEDSGNGTWTFNEETYVALGGTVRGSEGDEESDGELYDG